MEHPKVITPDLEGYWCEEQTIYVGEGTEQPAATIKIEWLDGFFAHGIAAEALNHAVTRMANALCDELNALQKKIV